MKMRDVHWTAGFLEGDGSFCFNNCGIINVSQKDLEPIERLRVTLGGSIYSYEGRPSQYQLNGVRAIGVMMMVYSLMTERRKKQIRTVLTKWRATPVYHGNKTHCKHGHPFDKENTHVAKRPDGGNVRICKTCRRINGRQNKRNYRRRQRELGLQM